MKTAGIIAEFNPFHNGHKYIIAEAKKTSDAVIAVMSGAFVQRGAAAVTDKWTRAEAALKNGADLIIELPVIYALNTAQKFAFGAVELLNKCGVADELVFGSEEGELEGLLRAAELMENESASVSEKIKEYVSSGMSYPSARHMAYKGIIADDILTKPNNILALEYLRAIIYTDSRLVPNTVKRTNDFHGEAVSGSVISAAAVRALMEKGEDISRYVPDADFDVYDFKRLETAAIAVLRMKTARELREINDASEGLENRIIAAIQKCSDFESAAAAVKTKRYTMSRVRRVMLSAALGLTRELCSREPSYIRILGMNDTGMRLLKEMKTKAKLPVIIKTADFKADDIFRAEVRATDFAALGCMRAEKRVGGKDYTVSPVVIRSS